MINMSGSNVPRNPGSIQRSYELPHNSANRPSRLARATKSKSNRLLWSMVALIGLVIVIVFVLLVVVLVWYEQNKFPFATVRPVANATTSTTSVPESTTPMPDVDMTIRTMLANSMDTSVGARSNFYEYACGNWKSGDGHSPDLVSQQQTQIYQSLSLLLQNMSLDDATVPDYQKMLSRAFTSCDTLAGPIDNIPKIKDKVTELGPWPLLGDATKDAPNPNSFWQLAGNLAGKFLLNTLLTVSPGRYTVGGESFDAIYIDQATLGLPTTDFDAQNPQNAEKMEEYKATIKNTAEIIAGHVVNNVDIHISAMLNFEQELYKHLNPNPNDGVIKPIAYGLDTLQTKYPNILWSDFFRDFWGSQIPNSIVFVVRSPSYLQSLPTVLKAYGDSTLVNYLIWRFVQTQLTFLGIETSNSLLKEMTSLQPISGCARFLSTNIPDAMNAFYIEKFPVNDSLEYVARKTLDSMQFNLLEHFSHADWLKNDAQSYENIKQKLLLMNISIGVTPLPAAVINEKYNSTLNITVQQDTPWSVITWDITNIYASSLWSSSNAPSNFAIATVLPRYYYETNNLIIPDAFIQSPFISPNFQSAWNLGLFGSLVGREMMKAFDTTGVEYSVDPATGEVVLQPLLQQSAFTNYQNVLVCLTNQYNGICSNNNTGSIYCINGNRTLNSNLLDNIGLDASYIRDIIVPASGHRSFDIPQLNLTVTNQQLFFLAMAQSYCTSADNTTTVSQILESAVPPNYLRVEGITQNSINFQNSFGFGIHTECSMI